MRRMSASTIRISVFVIIGLALLAAAGIWWRQGAPAVFETANTPVRQSGAAAIGGPFSLTDHRGNKVTEAALTDHLTLVYFGYASCPDVCPTELQDIGAALDLLAAGNPAEIEDVQALFITVDPARDTVAALADYMTNFHPKISGLTGSAEEVAAAAKAYRVYFSKFDEAEESDSYLMDHSNIIYLMGRDGEFVAHFGYGASAEQIAAKLREFQR